ncbi:MAG: glutamate racemase [Pseudomonas fluorescens]|nr:MAG: glutamate racemase [Pseudomonas fluorescens]
MIGVFDSGHGGLTVMRELVRRFPHREFIYLGDHANAPYGDRTGADIVRLTADACDTLFTMGCRMVIIACNTATAAAARTLQQDWLPTHWPDHKVLGIIAPTVEAATQTPWHVQEPVFPQKFNTDTIALFATNVTVKSGVYGEEIHKRCPRVQVAAQGCPKLVPLLESGAPRGEIKAAVEEYVAELLGGLDKIPEWAILGCTHYPLVADLFWNALPAQTRLLDQPKVVANALEDYLERHSGLEGAQGKAKYFTTGDTEAVNRVATMLVGEDLGFLSLTA